MLSILGIYFAIVLIGLGLLIYDHPLEALAVVGCIVGLVVLAVLLVIAFDYARGWWRQRTRASKGLAKEKPAIVRGFGEGVKLGAIKAYTWKKKICPFVRFVDANGNEIDMRDLARRCARVR